MEANDTVESKLAVFVLPRVLHLPKCAIFSATQHGKYSTAPQSMEIKAHFNL